MEYRILGRTGLRVSAVALGCEGFIHKTPEEVCADFDFAIGHGVNFVDIYSPNPELRTNIGAAHRPPKGTMPPQWPAWSGLPGKGIACTAAIAPPVRRE